MNYKTAMEDLKAVGYDCEVAGDPPVELQVRKNGGYPTRLRISFIWTVSDRSVKTLINKMRKSK